MTKKQSDELAIDFSKVLGVFKKSSSGHKNEKPKEGAGEPEQKEEFSLDLKGIWDGIFRYKAFILILIPIILGIMLRVQPLSDRCMGRELCPELLQIADILPGKPAVS